MNKLYTVVASAGLALSVAATAAQLDDFRAHPVSDVSVADNAAPSSLDADNTARNERDNAGRTLTPVDQSSEPNDLAITTRIREALIADGALGTDAKNVKVITINGQVTLRGPVANGEEHAKVVDIAKGIALPTQVRDELEMESP